MSTAHLNLARKWRSKTFDTIIGQDLSMKMLKNSLYLDQFFPVYLFAGQRGCGKTTTARVFAKAINCAQLPEFQKNPRAVSVPCSQCESCKAMEMGSHPDFIEMDAASHTGVDNVRQIIDAASLLPLLGRKKVYLIDEAHMLSKAAFNAFLKILEEPPSSVLFILATTDDRKIIETVRSRCFQLFFRAIAQQDLYQLLTTVCEKEKIAFDEDGLNLLIRETGGSARDALNLLEQVRFSSDQVTADNVLRVLGCISDEQMCTIMEHLLSGSESPEGLVSYVASINLESFAPEIVWHRCMTLMKGMVWHKYGLSQDGIVITSQLEGQIKKTSLSQLISLFDFICKQEQLFLKTVDKHLFLSLFWLRLWGCAHGTPGTPEIISAPVPVQSAPVSREPVAPVKSVAPAPAPVAQPVAPKEKPSDWQSFVGNVSQIDDQLLVSLFSQATLRKYDKDSGTLQVVLQKKFQLFEDLLKKDAPWKDILRRVFGDNAQIEPVFEENSSAPVQAAVEKKPSVSSASVSSAPVSSAPVSFYQPNGMAGYKKEIPVDISDKVTWATANALVDKFPGTVTEFKEDGDG